LHGNFELSSSKEALQHAGSIKFTVDGSAIVIVIKRLEDDALLLRKGARAALWTAKPRRNTRTGPIDGRASAVSTTNTQGVSLHRKRDTVLENQKKKLKKSETGAL
jgi:hypothetical protein